MNSILIAFLGVIAITSANNGPPKLDDMVTRTNQCLKSNQGKRTVQCVADVLGPDVIAAKEKIEILQEKAPQKIKDFLNLNGDEIKECVWKSAQDFLLFAIPVAAKITAKAVPILIKSFCSAFVYFEIALVKASEYKEQAKEYFNYLFNSEEVTLRHKRDMSTQEQMKLVGKVIMQVAYTSASVVATTTPIMINSFCTAYTYFEIAQAKISDMKANANQWLTTLLGEDGGRPKRDLATQVELKLAQQVKSCMETNGEKNATNCIEKVVGSNKQVDTVKIQAIINYEAVLEELKEYFKAMEQGKTLKEFLESKKHSKN